MAAAIVLLRLVRRHRHDPRGRAAWRSAAMPLPLLALWIDRLARRDRRGADRDRDPGRRGPRPPAAGRQPGAGQRRRRRPRRARRAARRAAQQPGRSGCRRPGRRDARVHDRGGDRRRRGAILRSMRPLQRLEVSRGLGRAAIAVAVIACRRRDRRRGPDRALRRVQGAADGRGARRRGGGPASRRRQRPLAVLGDGGRRLRERTGQGRRRGRLRALLARAPRDCPRSPPARTRCSSRRWPSSASSVSR